MRAPAEAMRFPIGTILCTRHAPRGGTAFSFTAGARPLSRLQLGDIELRHSGECIVRQGQPLQGGAGGQAPQGRESVARQIQPLQTLERLQEQQAMSHRSVQDRAREPAASSDEAAASGAAAAVPSAS